MLLPRCHQFSRKVVPLGCGFDFTGQSPGYCTENYYYDGLQESIQKVAEWHPVVKNLKSSATLSVNQDNS